jgi:SH3-like domain-containing protein
MGRRHILHLRKNPHAQPPPKYVSLHMVESHARARAWRLRKVERLLLKNGTPVRTVNAALRHIDLILKVERDATRRGLAE